MIVTTTGNIEGGTIKRYIDTVYANTVNEERSIKAREIGTKRIKRNTL